MLQFVQASLSNAIFAGLSFQKRKRKQEKKRKERRQRFLDNHTDWLALKFRAWIFDYLKFETKANCRLLAHVFFALGTVFRHFLDIYTYQGFWMAKRKNSLRNKLSLLA